MSVIRNRMAYEITILQKFPGAVKRYITGNTPKRSLEDNKIIRQGLKRISAAGLLMIAGPILYKYITIKPLSSLQQKTTDKENKTRYSGKSNTIAKGSEAILRRRGTVLEQIVENTNRPIKDLNELLIQAAGTGNVRSTTDLVKNGANVNATDTLGFPVLKYAVSHAIGAKKESDQLKESTQIIEYLLKNDADPNTRFLNNKTVLIFAVVQVVDSSIIKLLLQKADETLCDDDGKTASNYIHDECTDTQYHLNKSNEIKNLLKQSSKSNTQDGSDD